MDKMNNRLIALYREDLDRVKAAFAASRTYGHVFEAEDELKEALRQLRAAVAHERYRARGYQSRINRRPKFQSLWGDFVTFHANTAAALDEMRAELAEGERWWRGAVRRDAKELTKLINKIRAEKNEE